MENSSKAAKTKNSSQQHGDWTSRFPSRILARILHFATIRDVCGSQSVCKSWKLSQTLLDNLHRGHYLNDFEESSASSKEIAINGPETSWVLRYQRRMRIMCDLRSGSYQESTT